MINSSSCFSSSSLFLLLLLITIIIITTATIFQVQAYSFGFSSSSSPEDDIYGSNNQNQQEKEEPSPFFQHSDDGDTNNKRGGYFSRSPSSHDDTNEKNNNNNNDSGDNNRNEEEDRHFFFNHQEPLQRQEKKQQQETSSSSNTFSSFFYGNNNNNNNEDENPEVIDVSSSQSTTTTNNNKNNNKNQNDNVGIGSATSSVLGPHTSKQEVVTQKANSRAQSVPAKLLREWELKGTHHPCWKRAVLRLKSVCEDILAEKSKRTRLAIEFMYCQLELDGKQLEAKHKCDFEDSSNTQEIASCASRLPDSLYSIKVQFDNHVDTLCFHIQEELLHERTKQIVDRLGVASVQAARNLAELSLRSGQIDQSMQALHGSQKLATASAETLAIALRQVNEIGVDIKKAVEEEKVGMETISDKVQGLVDTHDSMRRSNEALAESLSLLAEKHIRAVGQLGTEVDSTRMKLLAGMEGLTSLQAKTSRFIGSLDAAIHYAFVFFVLWIVTTSQRTQDARFPALLVGLVASIIAERYFIRGFLKMFSIFGICTNPDFILNSPGGDYVYESFEQQQQQQSSFGFDTFSYSSSNNYNNNDHNNNNDFFIINKTQYLLDPTPIRNCFLILSFLIVAFFAFYLYQSPEEKQRKLLQLELTRAMNRALGKNSVSPEPPQNNSSGFGFGSIFGGSKTNKKNFNPRMVSSMEREDESKNGRNEEESSIAVSREASSSSTTTSKKRSSSSRKK